MRVLQLIALCFLTWLAPFAWAQGVEIPEYTPNVVDPGGVLEPADRQRVNEALQLLRETRGVWGALYVVPSLQGESIEALSSHAFAKWKLGRGDLDNGLLLVLAIQERRSRFEVGYGLEGVLPDIVARHALDEYLAPRMRQGDIAGASIAAFDFMGRAASSDPGVAEELAAAADAVARDEPVWLRGGIAWAGLVFLIWVMPAIARRRVQHRREELMRRHPGLAGKNEGITTRRKGKTHSHAGANLLKGFFTLNPGVFVWILSALFVAGFVVIIVVEVLVLVLVLGFSGHRYRSEASYREFLGRLDKARSKLIRRGHVKRTSSGGYAYTPAYHASRSSSSSSSSSSSFSSSSGGGSSGGGGASSSW